MSVYDDFFRGMTPESWEFFAIDFLGSLGFLIWQYPSRGPDGGSDAIVEYEGKKYVVSAKHYMGVVVK
jgi:HJR/Mrr/RecB family endonuclease